MSLSKLHGFTVIELSAVLLVMGILSVSLAPQITSTMNDQKIQRDSAQVKAIGEAAVNYIDDNYSTIMTIATPTTPVLITIPMLVSAGQLQTNTSTKNGYEQSICVLVKEPTAGNLQGLLVLEGGEVINDIDSLFYANGLGGAGGSVVSSNPTQIIGSGGSWTLPVADFNNLANDSGTNCDGVAGKVQITPGHAMMGLWFASEDRSAGSLSRNSVPSRPELNRMNAAIDMDSNNIDGAGTVTASTGSFSDLTSTTGTIDTFNATTGTINTLNATTANITGIANAGRVDTSIMYDRDNTGYYVNPASTTMLNAARANIYYDKTNPGYYLRPASSSRLNSTYSNYAHSYGNMTAAGSITSTGVMTPGWANEGWGCGPTGSVARKKWSGETLSCQSGRWKSQGGGRTGYYKKLSVYPYCKANPVTGSCSCPSSVDAVHVNKTYACTSFYFQGECTATTYTIDTYMCK